MYVASANLIDPFLDTCNTIKLVWTPADPKHGVRRYSSFEHWCVRVYGASAHPNMAQEDVQGSEIEGDEPFLVHV